MGRRKKDKQSWGNGSVCRICAQTDARGSRLNGLALADTPVDTIVE